MYNISNITGDPMNMINSVNTQTNGIWGAGILFSIFAIVFLTMSYNNKGSVAMMTASFITFISALVLAPTGLIEIDWIFAPIIVMVLSAFYVFKTSNNYDV